MIYVYPLLLVAIGFFLLPLSKPDRDASGVSLDLGLVFSAILLVYGFVPGVGFLLAHLGIGQIMDNRLALGFVSSDVEAIQWMHLLLVAGFIFGYFYRAKKSPLKFVDGFQNNAERLCRLLVPSAIFISIIPPLLTIIWGADVGVDYARSYTVLRGAPIFVQQIYGVLNQLQLSTLIAAIVVLIAAKPTRHLWVAAALAINMLYASFAGGSRTIAFLAFLAYIVTCSIFLKSFNWKKGFLYLFSALVLFSIAGMSRDKVDDAGILYLFQTGEFTVLFVNAIDLKENLDAGLANEFRSDLYLVDLLRLVPSQFLGEAKLDPAQWYAQTFYPEYFDAGGGFAFGILAESATGFGQIEAAARGLALGLLFRFCRNSLLGSNTSPAKVFVYVWMIAVCYQSYRDTTFSLAVRALYQVVPVLIIMSAFDRRRVHLTAQGHARG